MRTAVFSGAGLSKALGYPITSELLDRAMLAAERKELGGTKSNEADCDRFLSLVNRAAPGLSRTPDLRKRVLITDLFSMIEYCIAMEEPLGSLTAIELIEFRRLLKLAISDVLATAGPSKEPDPTLAAKQRELKKSVAAWIHGLGDSATLITTNYDIEIDQAIYDLIDRGGFDIDRVAEEIDLGFEWRDVRPQGHVHSRPKSAKCSIFKLHGSLDTLRCPTCGHVYFNRLGSIAWQAFRDKLDDNNTCHCSESRLDIHIVPPTLIRSVRDANLSAIWRNAIERLRLSDRWIFIGYSLPPEDMAIRSLILRALFARKSPPDIHVINKGQEAKHRYDTLFPEYHYHADGVEAMNFCGPVPVPIRPKLSTDAD
jgi:NAD-dependent SIR2 family protein deacetylase